MGVLPAALAKLGIPFAFHRPAEVSARFFGFTPLELVGATLLVERALMRVERFLARILRAAWHGATERDKQDARSLGEANYRTICVFVDAASGAQ